MATQNSASQPEDVPSYDFLNYKSPYKRQQNSLSGVLIPLMTFGMHIYWGIYVLFLPNRWTALPNLSDAECIHTVLSLYLGCVIGGAIAFISIHRFRINWICYISGVLSIMSGALYIPFWNTITPVAFGRYFGGISYGMAFVTAIIYAPEISIKYFRGSIMSTIHFSISVSLLTGSVIIAVVYDQNIFEEGTLDMLFGAAIVIFAVLGIFLTPFFVYESPVFYIKNSQDYDAIQVLLKLRGANMETQQTRKDFQELRDMYQDEGGQKVYTFQNIITKTFVQITGLRLLNSLSFSLLITWVLFDLALQVSVQFGLAVIITARFVVELVSLFLVDLVGRRKLLRLSTLMCGSVMILIAIFIWINIEGVYIGVPEAILCFVYGVAYGLGMGNVSLTYLGEAFSLRKKPISVLCSFILENALEIFLIVLAFNMEIDRPVFLTIIGALQIGGGLYFYFYLPETKYLSLSECLEVFH